MIRSSTAAPTIFPNAAPTITPTARSTTLPLKTKSWKSFLNDMAPPAPTFAKRAAHVNPRRRRSGWVHRRPPVHRFEQGWRSVRLGGYPMTHLSSVTYKSLINKYP